MVDKYKEKYVNHIRQLDSSNTMYGVISVYGTLIYLKFCNEQLKKIDCVTE